jgi:hypothetical protein
MIDFFEGKRLGLKQHLVHTMIGAIVVSTVFSCLLSLGCKKRARPQKEAPAALESVYTNRADDAAYMASLDQNRRMQVAKAKGIREAMAEMNAYRERVKASLPAGSDEAVLLAALAKDEAWLKLKAKCEAVAEAGRKEEQQTVAAARELVRQRMIKEAKDQAAVAEGKAKPIDKAK